MIGGFLDPIQIIGYELSTNRYGGLFVEDTCEGEVDDTAPCACLAEGCCPSPKMTSSKVVMRKQYFNIYFISESLSEPMWCDFAESKEDAKDIAYHLRRDDEIREDCDDSYFTHPASFYC